MHVKWMNMFTYQIASVCAYRVYFFFILHCCFSFEAPTRVVRLKLFSDKSFKIEFHYLWVLCTYDFTYCGLRFRLNRHFPTCSLCTCTRLCSTVQSIVCRVGDTMYHIIFILYDIVTPVIFILDSENVFHTYSCQNRHVHWLCKLRPVSILMHWEYRLERWKECQVRSLFQMIATFETLPDKVNEMKCIIKFM